MSQEEIYRLSDEDFKSLSPFDKKSCADCSNIKIALSMWCDSPDAIKLRGTRIPGCILCPYWKPDWDKIDSSYRTTENGYIEQVIPDSEVVEKVVTPITWYGKFIKYIKLVLWIK